jgi:5,10-methylenetetrahydromethanopterin reductase
MRMKISLQMHSLSSLDAWIRLASRADEYGFAEIHLAERIDFPFPTWPTLFLLAEHTKRIGLGTGVTNPYSRHPALTAKMAAFLDAFSNGRAIIGIGQGDFYQFDQLGIRHDCPLAALREAILLIRALLAGEGRAVEGEVFGLPKDFHLEWRAPRADLPVFVGSASPGGMEVAGEVADQLHLPFCINPAYVRLAREHVQLGMHRAGRQGQEIPVICSPLVGISQDREAAIRFAQDTLAGFIEWMRVPCRVLGIDQDEVARYAAAYRSDDHSYIYKNMSHERLGAFALAGAVPDVISQLERLRDSGVEQVTLNEPGPNLDEALELLGSEVLPYFSR